jgi:hypothetical protein
MKAPVTTKDEVRHLHGLLKLRDNWDIEVHLPDEDIAEDIRRDVEYELEHMTFSALYGRFLRWEADENKIAGKDYYFSFLTDVIYSLGAIAMKSYDDLLIDSLKISINFN